MATKPIQSLSVDQQIEAFYIGYYGAAADSEGFAKWQAKYAHLLAHESSDVALQKIADLIGASKETKETFPLLRDMPLNPHSAIEKAEAKAMVDTIYQNLFGTAPPAGDTALTKLANEFLKGTETIGDVVLIIANGAAGANLTAFENKVTVATDFTAATTAAGFGFPPTAAYLTEAQLVVADTTSDPTTVTTQENAITAWVAHGGGAGGTTYNLTTGIDNIDIATPGTYDTVNGIIDQGFGQTGSTFTTGDTITGNGHTTVDIAVESIGFGPFSAEAQLVTMSGVSTVNLLQGQHFGTLDIDANTWGSVNNINVSGFGDNSVEIAELNITNGGGLSLGIATSGSAELHAGDAKVSGLNYSATLAQNGYAGVGSVAKFGTAGIDATLGQGGYLKLELWQTADHTGSDHTPASVGNVSIAHINVNIGQSASASYVSVKNGAEAYGNNATAGNLTIGNVNYTIAQHGDGYVTLTNDANVEAGKGNATAGNVTLGNISVKGTGTDAHFRGYVGNYATAQTGNALGGNVTVGNVSIAGGKSASRTLRLSNSANASGVGNATVGGITVGNVSFTGNNLQKLSVTNHADAHETGNATVGNVAVGNVSMVAGTLDSVAVSIINDATALKGTASAGNVTVGTVNIAGSYDAHASIINKAFVSETGAAKVGNLTVGAVTISGHGSGSYTVNFINEATVGAGKADSATVGNLKVGNVSMAIGSGYNDVFATNRAHNSGSKGNATVGNLSVGNVTMVHNADAVGVSGGTNFFSVNNYAKADGGNASVGNVSIGNISINAGGVGLTGQTHAANEVLVYNTAAAPGGVATVGTITVGSVTAVTGADGKLSLYVSASADGHSSADAAGLVTVGNVSMQGAGGANMAVTVREYAVSGAAAGISIGNVSLVGSKALGTAELKVTVSGGNTGKISVGNIAITDQHIGLKISNVANSGAAGGISIGSVSLKGSGSNVVYQNAHIGAAGAISIGNVSLGVGKSAVNSLAVSNLALNKVGAVGIGNVTLAIANTNAGNAASANFHVKASSVNLRSGDNITAGNITIGSSGDTTKATHAANMAGHVTLDSVNGNVIVGNITVSGGVENTVHAAMDNFGVLSSLTPASGWLHLTSATGGTVTVGNIDYSGYASAATIDVQDYTGAASIVGSQGGSIITDNSGTNAINVSHTTASDTIYLQGTDTSAATTQNAVTDNGTVVTASQTAVDSIIGIHSGDTIEFSNGTGGGQAIGGGAADNGLIYQAGAVGSFATFLVNAATQIHTNGQDAYSADVGGNTYVAIANGSHLVGEIVEVTGVHTLTETAGVLALA